MYKWILKISEYWTKGNIIGWPDICRPNRPKIFPFVQYSLFLQYSLIHDLALNFFRNSRTISDHVAVFGFDICTMCQIMYKGILEKREYWTKGNILGQFGRQMSGQPMLFNIHLFWKFTYTWFGNISIIECKLQNHFYALNSHNLKKIMCIMIVYYHYNLYDIIIKITPKNT